MLDGVPKVTDTLPSVVATAPWEFETWYWKAHAAVPAGGRTSNDPSLRRLTVPQVFVPASVALSARPFGSESLASTPGVRLVNAVATAEVYESSTTFGPVAEPTVIATVAVLVRPALPL